MAMKRANIGEIKDQLSHYVSLVEETGEEIEVCRRNRPIARIVPIPQEKRNRTSLGCGEGTVVFHDTDLTEPFIPESSWEMLT